MAADLTLPRLRHEFATALPELCSPAFPEAYPSPRLVLLNDSLAAELGLNPATLATEAGLRFLLGADKTHVPHPVAQGYAGHQFGQLVPRLGDGRALLLGELATPAGELVDLHLKGSGRTPFARPGTDGRATLSAMLREYVIGEALHGLGVPSARILAVVATGRRVARRRVEPGAVAVRVAASHLRIGTFTYARLVGDEALLRRLAEFAIARHCPGADYREFFRHVVHAQARLVAAWSRFGFIHGVLNTDNVALSGQALDFGPCTVMDYFDPRCVHSSVDAQGRYAFGNQPAVMGWNLARLAEALLPLIDANPNHAAADLGEILAGFDAAYRQAWLGEMAEALGVGDPELADALVAAATAEHPDWVALMSDLADPPIPLGPKLYLWHERWRATGALPRGPRYLPRNLALDRALLAAEDGELAELLRLIAAVSHPFEPADAATENQLRLAPPREDATGFISYCGT